MLKQATEIQILGVYFPPFLVLTIMGLIVVILITSILNWTGWSRFFWHPPLAFLALWVLTTSLLGFLFMVP